MAYVEGAHFPFTPRCENCKMCPHKRTLSRDWHWVDQVHKNENTYTTLGSSMEKFDLVYREHMVSAAHVDQCGNCLFDEPFSKDMGTVYRRRELTGKKNAKYLSDTKNTDKRARVIRKPTVPRVLKSSVCYQEGKFDVSIYSDGRVLSQTDPVHLNINFVRQPVRVATPTGSGAKSKAVSQQKMEQVSKEPVNVVKNVKVDPQLRPAQNTKTHNHFEKKPRKGLVRMKNSPKLKFKAKAKPQQMSAEKAKSRKMSNTSENTQQKVRANIWKQSCDSLDWNIVERRAKKPPFNTHIDPEASCRHQQFFMDY